jgi:hypothetical protein
MAMLNNQMVYIIPNHTPWKHGHFSGVPLGSRQFQSPLVSCTARIFMQPEQMLHL